MIRTLSLFACLVSLQSYAGVVPSTSSAAAGPTWGEFLRGHWVTECKLVNFGVYGQAAYTFSDFTGTEFRIVAQTNGQYYDSNCSKPIYFSQNLGHLRLASLSGSQGEQPFTEPVLKGVRIRWGVTPLIQYPIAFYDKKLVAEQNRKVYCGKADWELGKAKDLLQSACAKDILSYYTNQWFFLEIMDADHLRLSDKAGNKEEVERTAFSSETRIKL